MGKIKRSKQTAVADGTAAETPSFESALERLEEIVRQLEEGQVGLAESLSRYEEGVSLLKLCYQILERAERRIEVLSGVDSAGEPRTEPFEDEPLSLEEKAQSRGRRRTQRRTGPRRKETDVDEPPGLF